jgi:uncharacterized protein (PEP-CTERM system associated)
MRRRPSMPQARAPRGVLAVALATAALAASAQQAAPAGGWRLQPYVSAEQTVTSNHDVSAQGEADAVTRLTAGSGLQARSAHWLGQGDLNVKRVQYARHARKSEWQLGVKGQLTGRAYDDRLTLETGLDVSRRALSALGPTLASPDSASSNVARTTQWHLAPQWRSRLGGDLRLSAKLGLDGVRVQGQPDGNQVVRSAQIALNPATERRLGWQTLASVQRIDEQIGRDTGSDRLQGVATWVVEPAEWQLQARAGREWSDVSTADRRAYATWGIGTRWTPGPRTLMDAQWERRSFGNTYAVELSHRLPRTAFKLQLTRNLSSSDYANTGQTSTAYQLFDQLLRSSISDPLQRQAAVLALLGNRPINAPVDADWLGSATTVQQRGAFSVAWRGVRQTATLTLGSTRTERVDPLAQLIDLLAQATRVRRNDLAVDLEHALTPQASLLFGLSAVDTRGELASQRAREQLASLRLNAKLGPDVTTSLGLRLGRYHMQATDYDETALTASLAAKF